MKARDKSIAHKNDLLVIMPLIFSLGIIPLIVYMKVVTLDGISLEIWGKKIFVDFFSYYKSSFIVFAAVAALLLGFVRYFQKEIKIQKSIIYIPIGVYISFVIFSSLAAKYKYIAFNGFPDHYEGMYVILSYAVLLIAVMNFVCNERQVKILLIVLFSSATLIAIIGIFQFFGHDFFASEIGKALIIPSKIRNSGGFESKLNTFTISSTLYNPNYVGSYMSLILPLSLVVYLFSVTRFAILSTGFFSCLMFANWIGCRSRAGIIGGIIALIVILIMLRKIIIVKKKSFFIILACFTLTFLSLNFISGGSIYNEINFLKREANNLSISNEDRRVVGLSINNTPIQDILLYKDRIIVASVGNVINISLVNNELTFYDKNRDPIPAKKEIINGVEKYTFGISTYEEYSIFYAVEKKALLIKKGGYEIRLVLAEEGFKLADNKNNPLSIKPIRKIDIGRNESLGSGRLFIWSRSIPLLIDTIFLGKGPDAFPIYFPQDDYIGKIIALKKSSIVVDKPHNMYLQMGINTGVISLISFVLILIYYFFTSFKLYIKSEFNCFCQIVGVGLLAAIIGYSTTGFFNDSVVSVAPVFWILLGLGISVNFLVEGTIKSDKEQKL